MADLKISQLTDGGNAQATDEYVIARSGANYRIDGASVAAAATSVGTLSSLTVSGAITSGATSRLGGTAGPNFGVGSAFSSGQAEVYSTSTTPLGIGTVGAQPLRFYTDSALRASFDSSGNLAVDTNTLYVDAANNRVGIGTASPSNALSVGSSASSTISLDWTGDNAAKASYSANHVTGEVRLFATTNYFPTFYAGNSERMRLDASGNLGLGVTPSAWPGQAAGYDVLQVGPMAMVNTADTSGEITYNAFIDSAGVRKYILTDGATRYQQSAGLHAWFTAPSGTSGNTITFTQAMTLDASGNLALGNATALSSAANRTDLTVNGTSSAIVSFGTGGTRRGYILYDGTDFTVANETASALRFLTSGSERARITSGGYFKASDAGTYGSATGSFHELRSSAADNAAKIASTHASNPYGLDISYTAAAPNGTSNQFIYCADNAALRATIRSNGGLANYQANDANLSDERVKTDIKPVGSYWDKFKAIEIVTFKYKDQSHDDDNIGVIAQQVEAVAPEFIDVDGFGETPEDGVPLKTVYTTDLYHASIKALQEAMARIESLEARLTALEN